MAHKAFTVSSSNSLTAQPSTGAKFYFRSTSAADTGNLSITGLVSASSTTEGPTALIGKREVLTSSTFTSITAALLSASQAGTVKIYQSGTAGTAPLRVETNPSDGVTMTFGLTGFTQAYRFKNTTAAAYDVKIGADATATALNLKKALNADGLGDGSDYHTGTAANPYVSATVSGTILTLTDRVPSARQLAWSFAQSSTHFSLPSTLSGGVDGTLLASISTGITQLFNSFTLSSEDLGSTTLPAKVAPTTDAVTLNGKQCVLQFKCANISSALALKYQTSTDGTNWSDGVTSITSLDDNSVASPQRVIPSERNIERIRLVFTSNTNSSDSAVDARVIYPLV